MIATLGFGQIYWDIEVVDTIIAGAYLDCIFNDIALDSNNSPHIVYNRPGVSTIVYSSRESSLWQKEVIDSGLHLCYGFSLIFDRNNLAHLSYYRQFDPVGKTYLCHAFRPSSGWQIEIVDSISGYLGNYFWYITSSIAFDSLGQPGISYIVWNVADSIHYVKYAHFNGSQWDTSVVEYDSAYMNITRQPSDRSPSLKFNSRNTPLIAFHHKSPIDGYYDTLKIARYNDTLNNWLVEPILYLNGAGSPISLVLSSQDYPFIAHCIDIGLHFTWWDGSTWHSGYTGADLGWVDIALDLALDAQDDPHIAFHGDPLTPSPDYCYKDSFWNIYWAFDTVPQSTWNINLVLDDNECPHICYEYGAGSNGLKYAKGTFVGVKEHNSGPQSADYGLRIFPNPYKRIAVIKFEIRNPHFAMSLKIYDATGRVVKSFNHLTIQPFNQVTWFGDDDSGQELSAGVYFCRLETNEFTATKKIIKLE